MRTVQCASVDASQCRQIHFEVEFEFQGKIYFMIFHIYSRLKFKKIQWCLKINTSSSIALKNKLVLHCTEVRFANFQSGKFTTDIVVNPPERKLAKHTSVHCTGFSHSAVFWDCEKVGSNDFRTKCTQCLSLCFY